MPTFDTPESISLVIEIAVGDVRITTTEHPTTTVEVRPSHPGTEVDERAAQQTRVEFAEGRLLVKGPKQRGLGLFGKPGSIDIAISVPAGSHVEADAQLGPLRGMGRLGRCRIRTGLGDVRLDETGPLYLSTGAGSILVDRVHGDAEVTTGSGSLRIAEIDGPAVVRNSNGAIWIGTVNGGVRAKAGNGGINVDVARADVTAASANGDVRIGQVSRGVVSVKTAFGELEVGVNAGTAAWLDVHTGFGRFLNGLDTVDARPAGAETVEVHAHTSCGDVIVRRVEV